MSVPGMSKSVKRGEGAHLAPCRGIGGRKLAQRQCEEDVDDGDADQAVEHGDGSCDKRRTTSEKGGRLPTVRPRERTALAKSYDNGGRHRSPSIADAHSQADDRERADVALESSRRWRNGCDVRAQVLLVLVHARGVTHGGYAPVVELRGRCGLVLRRRRTRAGSKRSWGGSLGGYGGRG